MSDWDEYSKAAWIANYLEDYEVGKVEAATCNAFRPIEEFKRRFPRMHELLSKARATPVRRKRKVCGDNDCTTRTQLIYLLGWDDKFAPEEMRPVTLGWETVPPGFAGTFEASDRLCEDHKIMLESFGGILWDWGGSYKPGWQTLTDNYYFAFVEEQCESGFARWQHWYELGQESEYEEEYENPIVSADYIPFAKEASGNMPAYHVDTGAVIMMAIDHCYDYVKPLAGCPEYTLYTINGCPDFRSWVEKLAEQWLEVVE